MKILAALALVVIVYKYFYADLAFEKLQNALLHLTKSDSLLLLILTILLMPLNWYLESEKWRNALKQSIYIPSTESWKFIFQGISLGIITPGRIGEYGGRVAYLPVEHRFAGAVSTVICSIAQNIINITLGILAGLLLIDQLKDVSSYSQGVFITGVILIVLLFIAYLKIDPITKKVSKLPIVNKFIPRNLLDIPHVKIKMKFKILLLSFLRYLVYLSQFYLLLKAFTISIPFVTLILCIAIIYFIQTLLPLTPILQFAIRGSIALTILGSFSVLDEEILLASYLIWFINLMIPALMGLIIFFRGKIYSKNN